MIKLITSFLITLIPGIELRGGLPLAISYALENNIPIFLIFISIILINIALIFFVFYFLDKIHEKLLGWEFYRGHFEKYLKRIQKKIDKFEKRKSETEFILLALFVAVPIPGTGAWSGSLISWILGLDRKKSILAISIGVTIAGTIIFLGALGFIGLLNFLT